MAGTGKAHLRAREDVVLRVEDLVVEFRFRKRGAVVHAVSGISLDVLAGETLGLVGESGCGKSSAARAIMQLPPPTSGSVWFDGVDLACLRGEELRRMRTKIQMIFQDPVASLNPRRKVGRLVMEPLSIWGEGARNDREALAHKVLEDVGIDADSCTERRPHEFSGGQCQRICIARALVLEPSLIICDEPVSSLDVSVQAQVLNLLEELKVRHGLTMIFISHDLAVVKNVSDRVAVMYLGKMCEVVGADTLYQTPAHPYSDVLMRSVPVPDPTVRPRTDGHLAVEPPSPLSPPSGCRFRTRCPRVAPVCAEVEPQLEVVGEGHYVACHFPLEGRTTAEDTRLPSALDKG